MEYHQCNESVKQEKLEEHAWEKVGFHTEFYEFRELRIFENFKSSCFSSGQGVVQIKPNSVLSITSVMRV